MPQCRTISSKRLALMILPLFLISGGVAFSEEATVEYDCHGNAVEACYLFVSGPIEQETVVEVNRLLDSGIESFQVLFNSDGGDLNAGIALGRLIRERNYQTRIGVYQEFAVPTPGECLSACAYAFLGGTQRIIQEGSRIGFHQFLLGRNANFEGASGLVLGQRLSAGVITYMVEMGVDARLFAVASETVFSEMYFPEREARVEYDIETPIGFGQFYMEPYGSGVVAASRRLGPTHGYDRVDQLTVYCRNGLGQALLTVTGEGASAPSPDDVGYGVIVSEVANPTFDQWRGVRDNQVSIRVWTSAIGAHIEISFDPRNVPITDGSHWFSAYLAASRAAGGYHVASVQLNDMDRHMLRTALRLCI